MDILPFNLIVNVWNKASEVGLEVAFTEEATEQTLPTMWISWLNSRVGFDRMLS